MVKRWLSLWGRPAALTLAAALCLAGLGGFGVFLARYYSEAPIVAFGQAAPQMQRVSAALAWYVSAAAVMLLLTLWLGWQAVRAIKIGRRKREAERLFEH